MTYPKMIIFDYGHTLLHEPDFNTLSGEEALFHYVKENKHNLTPKQVNDFSQKLFDEIKSARKIGFEIHETQFQKLLYEYLEITLSIPLAEAERVFWDHTSYGAVMPGADSMLDYINAEGIRSGVISNLAFSGNALKERIDRLLPRNKFEFIITSSEYVFCKPHPILFELALKKAGLGPGDVWFCGDNVRADVEGAANAGILPVWYDNREIENLWISGDAESPGCEHLHIRGWSELADILEKLKNK